MELRWTPASSKPKQARVASYVDLEPSDDDMDGAATQSGVLLRECPGLDTGGPVYDHRPKRRDLAPDLVSQAKRRPPYVLQW